MKNGSDVRLIRVGYPTAFKIHTPFFRFR